MKIWLKIIILGIIVLAILFSIAYVLLALKGQALIVSKLEELTQRKVSLGYFDVIPPLNIEIKNLNIEGLLKAENIYIAPSIPFLITGHIGLNKVRIVRPQINLEINADKDIPKTENKKAPPGEPEKDLDLRFVLKRLNIIGGMLNFFDHAAGENGIKISVKEINLNLTNLYTFPFSTVANFDLNAKIPWQEGQEEGKVEAKGWLNFIKKDVQAKISVKDIDGVYLYPYYSNWVDLEGARIEKAKLNFTSDIQGLDNNVTANCHLELADIVRRPLESDESQEKAAKITDAVLEMFKVLDKGKIVLDFTIRTKMDRPEFGFDDIKMAFESKLLRGRKGNGFGASDVLGLPGKIIEGTFKGLADMTSAVINGTVSAGKEIGKTIEGSFKKEKKEEDQQ